MSLYSKYLKEREGFEILEIPEGFATYKIEQDECYIRDIFVIKDGRKSGLASSMADKICEIAKGSGCKWLVGSVSPNALGAHSSMLVLIAYGMKLVRSEKDIVYFSKEI